MGAPFPGNSHTTLDTNHFDQPQSILRDFPVRWKESCSWNAQELPSYSEIHHPELGIIARETNSVETNQNPLEHSEVLAIQKAQRTIHSKYLSDCSLLTSLEPCLQCSGAIIKARLLRVVYYLPARLGTGISSLPIEMIYSSNHFPEVVYCPNDEVRESFREFFLNKRQ